jgi:hypothetical protein
VSVTATDFISGPAPGLFTIPVTNATYSHGEVTKTPNITVTDHNRPSFTLTNTPLPPRPVLTATGSGDNRASWNPVISVAVPLTAAPGTYTDVITHSVT